jgi:putative PEP-CTERM system TPR-repeat lipoprotein
MKKQTLKITGFIILIAVQFVIFSCTREMSDDELIQNARMLSTEGDYRSAVIELKKALQHDNQNQEARILLGNIYLILGNGEGAEKELRRAKATGVEDKKIILLLGKALLLQQKYDEALQSINKTDSKKIEDKADLYLLRGEIYLGQMKYERAIQEYKMARKLRSDSAAPILGMASVSIRRGKLDETEKLLNQAMQISNKNTDTWRLLGQYYLRRANYKKAENAFNQALRLEQQKSMTVSKYRSMVGLIESQMSLGKLDIASKNIDMLIQSVPKHPYPKYLKAWLAFQNHNYDLANKLLHESQKQMPGHVPSLFLLGSSNFAMGNYEQANIYLTRFVNAVPTHVQGRKLLAATRLKLEHPEDALKILQPAANDSNADVDLLIMASQAAASLGETEWQLDYLKKAAEIAPEKISIRTELARVYMQHGAMKEAIAELESIHDESGDNKKNQLIAYAYMRNGDYASARKQVNAMLEQTPNSPRLYVFLGIIDLQDGKRSAARQHFKHALDIKMNYVPAQLRLARMDLEDSNLNSAVERFSNVLQIDGSNTIAMLGQAQIAEIQGNQERALAWIEQARDKNRTALLPRVILVRYYMRTNRPENALIIANEIDALKPNSLISLLLLGQAQRQVGHIDKSVKTFEVMISKYSKSEIAFVELAKSYAATGDITKSRNTIERALELKPNSLVAQIFMVRLDLMDGRYNSALKMARKIQKDHNKNAVGFSLTGDIYIKQKKYKNAQQMYQKAIDIQKTDKLIVKLAKAKSMAGEQEDALMVLKNGQKLFHHNSVIETALAEFYHKSGKIDLAEQYYQQVLQTQPENPIVLNNLAMIYTDKDVTKALGYANQAYKITPNNVAIADTLGWLMVETGQVEKGLKLLREAALNSDNPTIQYHFAVALAKNGKTSEAKKKLKDILVTGIEFDEREQAKKLQNELKYK